MARRIKKANISFVSLVDAGANKLPVIYKADTNTVELQTLSKMAEDGEITAVVYAPELRDSQGDIASAEVIRDASYGFMAKGAAIDIMHDGKKVPNTDAFIAQSFIVQKDDSRFHGWKTTDNQAVDLTGAWATVIKVESQTLRQLYRDGKWKGVSMGGTAVVEAEKADDTLISRFVEAFSSLGKLTNKKDDDMTPQELEAAVAKGNAPILDALKGLTEVLAKSAGKTEEKKEEKKIEKKAPVYAGRADDEVALQKHERALEFFNAEKEADMSTSEGIRAYREAVKDIKKRHAEEDAEAKAERGESNQSFDSNEDRRLPRTREEVASLNKRDQALLALGREDGQRRAGTYREKAAK